MVHTRFFFFFFFNKNKTHWYGCCGGENYFFVVFNFNLKIYFRSARAPTQSHTLRSWATQRCARAEELEPRDNNFFFASSIFFVFAFRSSRHTKKRGRKKNLGWGVEIMRAPHPCPWNSLSILVSHWGLRRYRFFVRNFKLGFWMNRVWGETKK